MKSRTTVLLKLLAYEGAIEQLTDALKQFPWDYEVELVTLTRGHVKHVLQRYIDKDLTAQQVEDWANAIECREDIGFEVGYEEWLQESIHHLANPLLTRAITPQAAQDFLGDLK